MTAIKNQNKAVKTANGKASEDIDDTEYEVTLEAMVMHQAEQIKNLTAALSRVATLTGYGNHLKEFGIDKWTPTRKDMNKKFS